MFRETNFYKNIPEALHHDKKTKYLSDNLLCYAEENKTTQIYLIGKALLPEIDGDYDESGKKFLTILSPNHKIIFLNFEDSPDMQDEFEEYQDDFIDDLRFLAKKFKYEDILGRPRLWKDELISDFYLPDCSINLIDDVFHKNKITENKESIRKIEMLISLLVGSINDIKKIGEQLVFSSLLDQIKRQIILFDSNQTNFLYQEKSQKKIVIQGLSGTGKTELLLHKIKDIYSKDKTVFFTCHNKILAHTLKKRLIDFFDLFQVGEQIKWEEKLWCARAWGSENIPHSGLYSLICKEYDIPFYSYRHLSNFETVCKRAITAISEKYEGNHKKLIDYIVIDESQDFGDNFIALCELIVTDQVIIAGDIFQNIFGTQKINTEADFVLSKCYRTDPKTMMFAHGLSMGLFEPKKLQWLDYTQWNFCGYILKDEAPTESLILTRDPIRRFQELDSPPIPIHRIDNQATNYKELAHLIVKEIINLKNSYVDITPSDIAIIYMSPLFGLKMREYNTKVTYHIFEFLRENDIDWNINKAYETATISQEQLNITNYNNVKGLEFPFVICVDGQLTDDLPIRNATYMALTRSFLTTVYISSLNNHQENILDSLSEILEKEQMTVSIPSKEDLQTIQDTNLAYDSTQKTYKDIVFDKINTLSPHELTNPQKEQIYELLHSRFGHLVDSKILDEKLNLLINFFMQ